MIEFALVSPVLITMLSGLIDYGWYFWREALLFNGLREAVRAGGLQLQGADEGGATCSKCVSAATSAATSALTGQGYTITLTPTIERIPATGSPCTYAVVIDAEIPHERVFPLVPGPSSFDIRVLSMAQNLVCE